MICIFKGFFFFICSSSHTHIHYKLYTVFVYLFESNGIVIFFLLLFCCIVCNYTTIKKNVLLIIPVQTRCFFVILSIYSKPWYANEWKMMKIHWEIGRWKRQQIFQTNSKTLICCTYIEYVQNVEKSMYSEVAFFIEYFLLLNRNFVCCYDSMFLIVWL